ncbi:MAG: hypothetical protein HZA46_15105, partial [Planctomycetales bacterium]|nr:hypothetical protein [Planctomycetales bacterium]
LIEQIEGITRIGGSLGSTATTSFRLDFYATDVSEATSLEHGLQGKRYLGTKVVTTNSTGYVRFEAELPVLIGNEVITATATDPLGNTSEFSPFAPDMKGQGSFEVRTPVLVVPGFFGSFALDVPGVTGDDGNYRQFLITQGLPPTQLQLDPLIHAYEDIVITLERAGYVQGKDLFLAPYDWRLNVAPITPDQDQHDGTIAGVSAASLTDAAIDYGLDYLGYWLRKAAETWFATYGQPLANVQVIAHSMGGLLTRSYIQSTAYGDKFQSAAAGRELPLPVVSNFTMLGVPNQGGVGTWNGWYDNFVANLGNRLVLSKMINHAWHKLQAGEVIFIGSSERLTAATFENFDEAEAKVQFVRRYTQGLGNLLPNFNGFAIDFDPVQFPASKNLLLRDLNQQVLSGDRVARTMGIYGTSASTPAQVKHHVGGFFDDDDVVLSFTDYEADDSTNGVVYYEDILIDAHGDGTVAIESLENLFLNDARFELIPFCSGTCRPGDRASTGSVTHLGIVSNVDAQMEILKALNHPLSPSTVSTGHLTEGGELVLPFYTYNIVVDPVQGAFLVDSSGRQLGYSQITGAVTEIPGSVYFGNQDGIGWVFGDAGGPVRLELAGNGENHFVQVSSVGPGGGFGIESSGFLALGETRSVEVSPDFGDAPSAAQSGFTASYPTTLAANGARHTAIGPTLGSNRNIEIDGQPTVNADGDDTTGSPDDEDGVTFVSTLLTSPGVGGIGRVTINLQNPNPVSNKLDAWIDFNRDGDWSDAGEQVAISVNLGTTAGSQTLSFPIPAGASAGNTYARLRLSTAGGLAPIGAVANGEVEDYRLTINSLPALTRMYRTYNPIANFHFFTTSLAQFTNAVNNGYNNEAAGNAGFGVFPTQEASTTPLFRLYNLATPQNGGGFHYYTTNAAERDSLVATVPPTHPLFGQIGWRDEGIEGYMYSAPQPGAILLFRLYNTDSGVHLFTNDPAQRDAVLAIADPATGRHPWQRHSDVGYAIALSASEQIVDPESFGGGSTAQARRASVHGPDSPPDASLVAVSATFPSPVTNEAGSFSVLTGLMASTDETHSQGDELVDHGDHVLRSLSLMRPGAGFRTRPKQSVPSNLNGEILRGDSSTRQTPFDNDRTVSIDTLFSRWDDLVGLLP